MSIRICVVITVGTWDVQLCIQSIDSLTLLVGQQAGHPVAYKYLMSINPSVF